MSLHEEFIHAIQNKPAALNPATSQLNSFLRATAQAMPRAIEKVIERVKDGSDVSLEEENSLVFDLNAPETPYYQKISVYHLSSTLDTLGGYKELLNVASSKEVDVQLNILIFGDYFGSSEMRIVVNPEQPFHTSTLTNSSYLKSEVIEIGRSEYLANININPKPTFKLPAKGLQIIS